MGEKQKHPIEIAVPEGSLCIQNARCPKGCDLMDAGVRFQGQPSIFLTYRYEGREGQIHLNPFYGRFEKIAEFEVLDGAVVDILCPHCGTDLRDAEETCHVCSAPMFALQLPKGGYVQACSRTGCFHHRMNLMDIESIYERMIQDHMLDAYL